MRFNLSSDEWAQLVILPLSFSIIGILAKRLGRRDGDKSPRQNDFAISTSFLLMTFGKVFADALGNKSASKDIFHNPLLWTFGIILAIFVSIDHDRYRSWKKDPHTGELTNRKRLFTGVILPNFISIIVFISYYLNKFSL